MTEPEDAAQLADDELLNAVPSDRIPRRRMSLSSPAMIVGMFALTMSLLTPWAVPLGIVGVVLALVALGRRHRDRVLAGWGLGLSLMSLAHGVVWALWIVGQLGEVPAIELPLP